MATPNVITIILSIILLTSAANKTSTRVVIQKCCPQDQKLTFTMQGLQCVKVNDDITSHDAYWWLPDDSVAIRALLSSTNGSIASYGTRPTCARNSMDVLTNHVGEDTADFSLHARAGEARLDGLKDSSFHDPDRGREDSFRPDAYCVDAGPAATHVAILCPCDAVRCVRKCCMDGFAFDTATSKCVDADNIPGLLDWTPRLSGVFDYYRLTFKQPYCDKRSVHVMATTSNRSQILLFPNASIQVLETGASYPADEYCGTHTTLNQEMIIFCMQSTKPAWSFIVYGVLFLIGAAALLATVVVTAILPEMRRNIHGRMALAHNATLFVGYAAIGVSQLRGSTVAPNACAVISLIIQFSILSAFFWLNVMCIDISWTFSGLRPIRGTAMQRDRKKFIYYSLYAWGSTALISMATLIVEYSPSVTRFKPNFGAQMCFFNDRWALFVFFYGPMALLLLGNLLLFMFTAFKIFAVRRDTAILNAKDSSMNAKNKQKLILYVKLFCLMGVTYVTEVIAWAVGGTSYWWYLTDAINILRAVFIFVIFCCKRTVYTTIRDKVLRLLGKQVPARNTLSGMRSYQSHTSCTGTSTAASPNASRKLCSQKPAVDVVSNPNTEQIPDPKV